MNIEVRLICLILILFTVSGTANAQCDFSCRGNLTITHMAGGLSPVTGNITYSTVAYNSLCWITKNLGATQQAASATDASDEAAGWFWQFNRRQGYSWNSTGSTRTPDITWNTSIDENSDWLPENDPCTLLLGAGWRIPTRDEWTGVRDLGGWTNYNDAYASPLKLHGAGIMGSNGIDFPGGVGYFWSSIQNGNTQAYRQDITLDSGANVFSGAKAAGRSVRCCRNL